NDVYVFNLGDGQDTIFDAHSTVSSRSGGSLDAIEFGAGITLDNVRFRASGVSLIIEFEGSDDRITITEGFRRGDHRIEEYRFEDGTVLTFGQVIEIVNTSTDGDDTLADDSGSKTLDGGAGNDTIDGWTGSDRIIGGSGNDNLRGGSDNDVYVFNLGDGQDTIFDAHSTVSSRSGGSLDAIEFGASITQDMVRFRTSGVTLFIEFEGSDDQITITEGAGDSDHRIEEIRFADGSVLTHAQYSALYNTNEPPAGLTFIVAPVSEGIEGTDAAEILDASGETAPTELRGRGGFDTLLGGSDADTLDGGTGNDTLSGGTGADVYRFEQGFGQDTINDTDFANIIEFGAGIAPADLVVEGQVQLVVDVGQSFVGRGNLRIAGTDDRINLEIGRLSAVRFADGTEFNFNDLVDRAVPLGFLNQTISAAGGSATEDTLVGLDGDEILRGLDLNDTLDGGAGNDRLEGGDGDDTLTGGTGNDFLAGGTGADTYLFSLGFGSDEVFVEDNRLDWIEFDATITSDMVTVTDADPPFPNVGSFGLFLFNPATVLNIQGTEDRITLTGFSESPFDPPSEVAGVRFADGTVWTAEDLQDRFEPGDGVAVQAGDADDNLVGGDGADVVIGGAGNDVIEGQGGPDQIDAGAGDDTIDAGSGRDLIYGGSGSDTFVFGLGSGVDVVFEEEGDVGTDVIEIRDFGPSDIAVYYSPDSFFDDIILRSLISDDSLRISRGDLGNGPIEEVRFADGTVWSGIDLQDMADAPAGVELAGDGTDQALTGGAFDDVIEGGAGNETLIGGDGNDDLDGDEGDDVIVGGAGNDTLNGGAGADIYQFSAGFGDD
ncbi:MAG: calcium-binding protein, partial [Pseudomonadota bacterium]